MRWPLQLVNHNITSDMQGSATGTWHALLLVSIVAIHPGASLHPVFPFCDQSLLHMHFLHMQSMEHLSTLHIFKLLDF